MKKFMSVLGICGAAMLAACDSNAGAKNGDTVIAFFLNYKETEDTYMHDCVFLVECSALPVKSILNFPFLLLQVTSHKKDMKRRDQN